MSNLENILQTNESKLDLKLILKVFKSFHDKSGHEPSPDYKLLESRVEKRTGFSQQKVDNMYASPQIFDWSDFRELYSKYDIAKFLDQFPSSSRIDRNKIDEITNFTGFPIPGLKLNMTVQELSQLVTDRHDRRRSRNRKRDCNRHDKRRSRQSDDYYSDNRESRSCNQSLHAVN